jgi:hypothetical protein
LILSWASLARKDKASSALGISSGLRGASCGDRFNQFEVPWTISLRFSWLAAHNRGHAHIGLALGFYSQLIFLTGRELSEEGQSIIGTRHFFGDFRGRFDRRHNRSGRWWLFWLF